MDQQAAKLKIEWKYGYKREVYRRLKEKGVKVSYRSVLHYFENGFTVNSMMNDVVFREAQKLAEEFDLPLPVEEKLI